MLPSPCSKMISIQCCWDVASFVFSLGFRSSVRFGPCFGLSAAGLLWFSFLLILKFYCSFCIGIQVPLVYALCCGTPFRLSFFSMRAFSLLIKTITDLCHRLLKLVVMFLKLALMWIHYRGWSLDW